MPRYEVSLKKEWVVEVDADDEQGARDEALALDPYDCPTEIVGVERISLAQLYHSKQDTQRWEQAAAAVTVMVSLALLGKLAEVPE